MRQGRSRQGWTGVADWHLLHLRKVRILDPTYPLWDTRTVATLKENYMKEMFPTNRLELCSVTYKFGADGRRVPESNEEAVRRIHDRDLGRVDEAVELERSSWTGYSEHCWRHRLAGVKLNGHNLDDPSEISTLCHYLRDKIIHKYGAWYMHPREDIGLLNHQSWHVSFANNHNPGYTPVTCQYLDSILQSDSNCDEVAFET